MTILHSTSRARRALAVISLIGAGWLPPAIAAYVVVEPGTRPIGVAAPTLPTSAAQCNDFAAEVLEFSKRLHELHDTCLRKESGKKIAASHKGQCSFPACEPVHGAMSKFNSASSKELSQCRERAAQAERAIREAFAPYQSIEAAQAQFSKLAPLAVQKMQTMLRQKIEQQVDVGIARVREQLTPSEISRTAQDISVEVMKAAAVCRRELGTARSIECDKQAYLSIASLQTLAPFATLGSPIVIKIQAESFQHLNRINQETLQRIHSLSEISEAAADDDGGGISLGR